MVELIEANIEFKFAKSLKSIISITQNISNIDTKNSDITANININIDEPAKEITTINFKVKSSNKLATGTLSNNFVSIPIGEKSATTKIKFLSSDFYNLKDIVYVNVLASTNEGYIEPTKNNCEFKVTGHSYIPDSEKQQLNCFLDFELDNIYFIEGIDVFSKEFYINSSNDLTKEAKININISGLDESDYSLYIEREPLKKPEITLDSKNKYVSVEIKIKKSAINKTLKIRLSSYEATLLKGEESKEIPILYYKTPEEPIDYKMYYDIENKTEVDVKSDGWLKLKFHTKDKVDVKYPVIIELDDSSTKNFEISVGKITMNAMNSEKMVYLKVKNYNSLKNGDNIILKFKSAYTTFKENTGLKLNIVK
ncbi:MAG: hypothetical protein IMY73_03135 [Bacteroidetes bacterium]|nr:hypothetical protein [Bacteroidota bacterium]